jgi:hypothetical protein
MSHCCRKLILALAVLATLAPAVPVSAADVTATVPFRGQLLGRVIGRPTPIPEGEIVEWQAAGEATYMGQFTGQAKHTAYLGATVPRDGDIEGAITLTGAGGDQLTMNIVGKRPVNKLRTGTLTITGGTGRFAGATGTVDFSSVDADIVTVFTITFDGQLSLTTPAFAPDVRPSPEWLAAQGPMDAMPVLFGRTRDQWAAAWWQWALSIPRPDNPLLDATGAKCDVGQSGPVWFLAGALRELEIVTRTCTVPAGKALFIPIANTICITEPNQTAANLYDCLALSPLKRGRILAFASVDRELFSKKALETNREQFRLVTPPFPIAVPANNILGINPVPAATAAADGYYVMLAPLPVGQHVIQFKAFYITPDEFLDWTQDVTYHITVVAPPPPSPPAPSAGALSFIPPYKGG